jgi:hypothetical protein
MPLVGFDPAIPASGQLQAHALDHVVTGISEVFNTRKKIFKIMAGVQLQKLFSQFTIRLLASECVLSLL